MRRAPVLIVVSMLMVGCAPSSDPDAAEDLMAADRRFAVETAERGADGWAAHFAEDGVMFQGGGRVDGRDAILEMMTAVFADTAFSLDWEPEEAHLSGSADLGYTIGRYRAETAGTDGPGAVSTGSYVTIWEKQPDGRWLVVLDIGNPDAPRPTPSNED